MPAVSLPASLQHNVRSLAAGGLRFVRDVEGTRDHGPGYACFETDLSGGKLVRIAAAADPAGPTVVEFWVPGGPWGTEIELCDGVLGATVDGKFLGCVDAQANVDGVPVRDVIESLRSSALAAERQGFVLGVTDAGFAKAA